MRIFTDITPKIVKKITPKRCEEIRRVSRLGVRVGGRSLSKLFDRQLSVRRAAPNEFCRGEGQGSYDMVTRDSTLHPGRVLE